MARLYKSFASFSILGISLYFIFNSCIEQQVTSKSAPANQKNGVDVVTGKSTTVASDFSSDVGAPIDRATAVRWMNNFTNSNKSATSEFVVPVSLLKSILAGTSCVGVVLYYAADPTGELHIIPIGVDGTGKVIAWKSITLGNAIISWQTAWQWINNYSGTLRSHFFGSQIITSTYFKSKNMRMTRAINDTGDPQLLLSDADVITPQSWGDESRPCPPYCSI